MASAGEPTDFAGRDPRTTSMLRNSAKAHWTLQELGWTLQPPGSAEAWDGLTRWFVDYTEAHPELAREGYLKRWRRAAVRVLDERSGSGAIPSGH